MSLYKFVVQGGNGEEEDEVGEWRGRRSDILDIREGGDTIRCVTRVEIVGVREGVDNVD